MNDEGKKINSLVCQLVAVLSVLTKNEEDRSAKDECFAKETLAKCSVQLDKIWSN